ncbi:MAG: energy transducer TonB [Cytophagales bacterium]|nr:energy transducer TonB [Cytophagales bacterium]
MKNPLSNFRTVRRRGVAVALVAALCAGLPACRTTENIEPNRSSATERVAQQPQLTDAFGRQLMQTVQYPQSARADRVEGKVTLGFTVTETGQVTDVKVVKGIRDDLDQEAMRAFGSVKQAWQPGTQGGKPQSVRTTASLLFFFSPEGQASVALADPANDPDANPGPDADGVYTEVEQMPDFAGGFPALATYLSQNLKYPAEARTNNVTGTVFVEFVVRADGSVEAAKVLRGPDASLGVEAVRVVQAMPKWVPGQEKGQSVPVRYVLPIKFALSDQ